MGYIVVHISPLEEQEKKEFLVASLSAAGFEGFSEERDKLTAYIPSTDFDEDLKNRLDALIPDGAELAVDRLPEINWNEEWEKNYPPVIIRNECYIRAPFHPARPEFRWQALIEPKMSFGTAHHETTRLMLEWMLDADISGKRVLDMGCGTGILAILGLKMGAAEVMAIDNDEWAWRNARDNFRLNGFPEDHVFFGDASLLRDQKFDLIVANINRNILLNDIPVYARSLHDGGTILLSGFYQADRSAIVSKAFEYGLKETGSRVLNDWVASKFEINAASR